MTKKILFIVLLASIQLMYSAAAQDSKQPVQFVFSATKLTDSTATLKVQAVAAKGTRIFTAVKKNSDDVFVSALQLDSSASVKTSVKEEGVAGVVALPGATYKGTAYDSVTFEYTLGIKAGATAVKGSFNCDKNILTTLEGTLTEVGTHFYCKGNLLTDLVGGPTEVGGVYDCSHNKLKSLKGAPKSLPNGTFNCLKNNLESLEGIPKFISGDFFYSKGKERVFTEAEIRAVSNIKGKIYLD